MTALASKSPPTPALQRTPLYALHGELGAKLAPFAGYEMPVSYPAGIIKEHLHTRAQAALFDVSHMGQAFLAGPDHATTARALEALVPGDILGLQPGEMRYTLLLNETGGIIDDLIVTRSISGEDDGALFIVVNAARKEVDYAYLQASLPKAVRVMPAGDRALLALQGPKAAEVLARHAPKAASLSFMTATSAEFDGNDCHISRSGYTGEDGFEISVRAELAEKLARALLAEPEVRPAGLGARDTLRLEAGLCLYGQDMDETITPPEASLAWCIAKRRRAEGGFPGAGHILRQIKGGPRRRRIGLQLEGRAAARHDTQILSVSGDPAGQNPIGYVTSGSFAPTLGGPIAMGYVLTEHAAPGTPLKVMIRGNPQPAEASKMPFVPHRYKRSRQE